MQLTYTIETVIHILTHLLAKGFQIEYKLNGTKLNVHLITLFSKSNLNLSNYLRN